MTTLAWTLIGVSLGLTLCSLGCAGWVVWQLKGLQFGLVSSLQKQLETLAPELSEEALKELRKLESSFRTLETEWTSQHGAMNKIAGRIERRLQEIEGTHKGGPNAKGRNSDPPGVNTSPHVSPSFAASLELETKA